MTSPRVPAQGQAARAGPGKPRRIIAMRKRRPMPTECSPALFEFAPVGSRAVVAGFDGGAITSNAGALLLGATDGDLPP